MRAGIAIAVVPLAALITAGAALTTAGCATAPGNAAPFGTGGTRATSRAATSPSPTGPVLGQSAQADNGQMQATVYGYRQQPGSWAATDVEVCNVRTAIFDVTVSRGPWQLILPDGGALSPELGGDPDTPDPGVPRPEYPRGYRRLAPGECVRGWLEFPAPPSGRPVAVRYSPAGAHPVVWPIN